MQESKRTTMTRNAITSLVTNMMPPVRLSGVKPGRKRYDRVCGIIPLVCARSGVTISVMQTTGKEVASRKSENVPGKSQHHRSDALSTFNINQLFSKLPHLQRIPPGCSHLCTTVCVCVCVCLLVVTYQSFYRQFAGYGKEVGHYRVGQ